MISFDFLVKIWIFWLQANMILNSKAYAEQKRKMYWVNHSTRCISLMGHIVHRHWRLRRAKVDTKMTRNLPGRFFCSCFQTLFKLWWLFADLPRSLPPTIYTSLPQAFCSSGRREKWMMARNVQHSVSVSEFLLRHGNAPTCLQTLTETHPHTETQKHTQSSCKGKRRWKKKTWRNELLDIISLYRNYRLWVPVRVCFLKISLEGPTWWCSLHLGPSVRRLP